ncbi:hypothetical protein [Prevotella ihumii]|uniref:hypothetical protein n=1 Tax=Prevotella ihumii TaxID=1917878 RepID=UPI0012B57CF3|nr:hypothetical protein [Prevotella ihumii]
MLRASPNPSDGRGAHICYGLQQIVLSDRSDRSDPSDLSDLSDKSDKTTIY